MLKKITCAAILAASINSAHAGWWLDVTEDPMTDVKSPMMGFIQPKIPPFVLRYICWNDKDRTRLFEIWPSPPLQYLFKSEQPEPVRVRLDRGKIHTLDFVPAKAPNGQKLFEFRYRPDNTSERQKFEEFERDLFQSTNRFVFELKGETHVLETGDARVVARQIIEICGAV